MRKTHHLFIKIHCLFGCLGKLRQYITINSTTDSTTVAGGEAETEREQIPGLVRDPREEETSENERRTLLLFVKKIIILSLML